MSPISRPSPAARLGALLGSAHPEPAVAVTLFTTVLAVATGRGAGGSALVAASVLAGQLSIGWSNDALDARRDVLTGRRDKPVAAGALSPRVVGVAAAMALLVCVPLSLANGLLAGSVHLLGMVAAGWAYNLGLKRTVASPLTYAVGFGTLPAFVTLGLPGAPWPAWWAVVTAALLGVGAHLVNALPDIEGDLATGVRGFPQRIGRAACRTLTPLVMLAAVGVLLVGTPGRIDLPSLIVAGVAVAVAIAGTAVPAAPDSRRPFRAAVLTAALAIVLFLFNGSAVV
ncbi:MULTISPECIES: UbiA family prenyltransferase [Actinoalloteichus]|uniref:4-hydroxybenzoate polyprenyltransferase-like prenyltransferase n=1 Tax=Actinoalloteichus fjordicus TaxID=1612552 RepID=A0AAC9PT51_9PSEU|nr:MULTISPECIES: UbiA family prenyltransferase [Actinoalloteichus]APU15667.1 4-hydroxybenzoate polyprenyltransferase-like prenyltransferase [Actinoalloteichus fjordicus]APU21727.1 4-hydroxybenzoate polyprenyltransferase-like prenyltransferase [Actinoalloteichus sp. GBA129-24]